MRDHPLYRHRRKLLIVVLVILLLALLLPTGTEREEPVPEDLSPPEIMPAPNPAARDSGEATAQTATTDVEEMAASGDMPAALRRTVADLELALAAAVEERKRAEAALEQSEQDVAELERYIEEIEERGEEPVDYADEGLERFRPAFFAFEEASARLEQAELGEAALRAELAAAERRLMELEAVGGTP